MDEQGKLQSIYEYANDNKSNNIDPQEWNKISKLFVAETQSHSAETSADNLKELRNHLDSPFVVGRLLGLLSGQINSIKTEEDLKIYESCLNAMISKIQAKAGTENDDADLGFGKSFRSLDSQIDTIKAKLAAKKNKLVPDVKKVEEKKDVKQGDTQKPSPESTGTNMQKNQKNTISDTKDAVATPSTTGLETQFASLDKDKIIEFKGVIDNLKDGLLTPEKIKPFASMMNILRQMNGVPKEEIMALVENVITTKFADQKNSPDAKGFKDVLTAVLDKNLIGEFVNKVDTDLNNNEQLKGAPYGLLLDSKTDLKSPEAQAGINTLFHRDEVMFTAMIKDFEDPAKKPQIEDIVKAYIASGYPNENLNGTSLVLGKVKITDAAGNVSEKSCFNLMKDNTIVEVVSGKDKDGNAMKQKLTPYFGDQQGKALSMEACLNNALMEGVISKETLKMPGVANVMKELVTVNGKPRSFAEAITSLFNSPLFDQLKQAFFTLISLVGKDANKESAQLELQYLTLKNDIRKRGMMPEIEGQPKMSYVDALAKCEPQTKYKSVFVGLDMKTQKEYIETAMKSGITKATDILKGKMPPESKTEGPDTVSEKSKSFEFANGKEYKELSLDGTKLGKVEKVDKDKDNPYLKIDGQVVPLVDDKGLLFVQGADGKIVEKKISLTTDAATKKESVLIEDATALDNKAETIASVFKDGKLSYPSIGPLVQGTEDLFRYYALEQGVDGKNPIDGLMNYLNMLSPRNTAIDQAISTMKRSLSADTTKTKDSIQKILKTGKQTIANEIAKLSDAQKKSITAGINAWASAVGVDGVKTEAKKPASTTTQLKK